MHPPLFRPHPLCEKLLVACHEEHKFGKWFGACNDDKAALDRCFKMEKEIKRKGNMDVAREFDNRFEEYVKQRQEEGTLGVFVRKND
eukprot:scaffold10372_cov243-Ochromonas_danica.AAC.3